MEIVRGTIYNESKDFNNKYIEFFLDNLWITDDVITFLSVGKDDSYHIVIWPSGEHPKGWFGIDEFENRQLVKSQEYTYDEAFDIIRNYIEYHAPAWFCFSQEENEQL